MRLLLTLLILASVTTNAQSVTGTSDSDGDGLTDIQEDRNSNGLVDEGETSWSDADTDGGGESDGTEVAAGRDPLDRKDDYTYDLDNDGLTNGQEAALGTDPAHPDSDRDGLNDADDRFPLEAEFREDSDNDGLPNAFESRSGLSAHDPDDAKEDKDNDGLSNLDEFIEGTDPNDSDTDKDGKEDGLEKETGDNPGENACLNYIPPASSFLDTRDHWAEEFIHGLHRIEVLPNGKRVIDGYSLPNNPVITREGATLYSKLFLPNREISRYELLKLAMLTSCIRLTPPSNDIDVSFTDFSFVERPNESSERAFKRSLLATAVRYDIIRGYTDGSFRPDAPVNRAEALKILLLATGVEPIGGYFINLTFSDTSDKAWYAPYVQDALELDLVRGYEDGTFRPEQSITRAEAAKIVYLLMVNNPRVNGYVVPSS